MVTWISLWVVLSEFFFLTLIRPWGDDLRETVRIPGTKLWLGAPTDGESEKGSLRQNKC